MKTVWKKLAEGNKDKEDDILAAFADAQNFREFLRELLEDRIESARNASERDAYDLENWALKQADTNGCIRTYKEIIGLLDK